VAAVDAAVGPSDKNGTGAEQVDFFDAHMGWS
jgi:hypothetical protein